MVKMDKYLYYQGYITLDQSIHLKKMMINIHVNNLYQDFSFKSSSIEKISEKVLTNSNYSTIDLNFIFCDDLKLNALKIEYFNEDVLTDVLTFPLRNDTVLESEIYISVDRAIDNAKENNLTLQNEIIRLIVHSLLHLLGYDDDTKERKEEMFLKQEGYINQLSNTQIL